MGTTVSLPFSQSCENNKAHILAVLRQAMVSNHRVLEIGSGTGQHAIFFAEHLSHLFWQPSDQGEYLKNLRLWLEQFPAHNLGKAMELDVTQEWPQSSFDGVFTANTCHIMSWHQVKNMMVGVGNALEPNGVFCIYGPFNRGGDYTSESNAAFDQMLRTRDSLSGIRNLEDMEVEAIKQGMELSQIHEMPANNLLLEFRKTG